MGKNYVKFETPKTILDKIKQAVSVAKESGRIRKGINEVTKSIEASNPSLVVMAEDVDPEEIVLHIPLLCEEKGVYYCYLPTKKELGSAAGLDVPCSCVAIEQEGQSSEIVRDIREALDPLLPKKKSEEKKEEQKPVEEQPQAEAKKPKKPKKPKKKEDSPAAPS
ncbi:MAG: 50S ribosomal protein L7Ae [Candidatus Anstonellales archaeon]